MIAEALVVSILRNVIFSSIFMSITALVNVSANLSLLLMACKSSRVNMRYRVALMEDVYYPDNYDSDMIKFANTPVFKVVFQPKALNV